MTPPKSLKKRQSSREAGQASCEFVASKGAGKVSEATYKTNFELLGEAVARRLQIAASLARKNQVVRPESENTVAGQQRNSISVVKRGSHRPSIMAANLANMSAPHAPSLASPSQNPHARKASTTSGPSMSGLAMQCTVSASESSASETTGKGDLQ